MRLSLKAAVCLTLAAWSGFAASLSVANQMASAGQTVIAPLSFSAEGQAVSGIQFDVSWDAPLDVKIVLGNQARTALFYSASPEPRTIRCIFFGASQNALADGELLKLFLVVNGEALPGPEQIRFSNAAATDPDGNGVTLRTAAITVQVQSGSGPISLAADSILNAASLLSGPVAPGEIITVLGYIPATHPSLFFNGDAALVIYAGSNQVNAVVPFGLDVSAPANLELHGDDGKPITKLTLPVASVAPAIFTQSGAANGPGAVLNEDYSVNSFLNSAAPGSTIMIYGTGFGLLNPSAVDGETASSQAATVASVTASVAGVAAEVVYAGAAPGLIAGVAQINVRIPEGLPPSAAARLELQAGTVATPAGVTVSIR